MIPFVRTSDTPALMPRTRKSRPPAGRLTVTASSARWKRVYDTPTGENGNLLSGGERQRISIARAILKNSPILLLDEATASLDIENELSVKQAIANLLKEKKTVVMIAHTLSIVKMQIKSLWYLTERLLKPVLTMNCWLKAESMRPCGTPNRNYLHKGGLNETSCVREDYLETILVLQKKLGMVRSVDVARHMEVSKPSVCHAVATLRDGGFLTMDEDHFLHLTDVGREVAEKIYERHCFFTEQLIAAGVDPRTAEADACRIEHIISDESFSRLKEAAEQEQT